MARLWVGSHPLLTVAMANPGVKHKRGKQLQWSPRSEWTDLESGSRDRKGLLCVCHLPPQKRSQIAQKDLQGRCPGWSACCTGHRLLVRARFDPLVMVEVHRKCASSRHAPGWWRLMASARSSCVTVVAPEVKWAPSGKFTWRCRGMLSVCLNKWTWSRIICRLTRSKTAKAVARAHRRSCPAAREHRCEKPRGLEAVRPVDQWDTELPEDQEDVIPSMELHEVQIAQHD